LGIADFFAIGFYDSAYPELLKHILYPPLVLFCLGDLAVLEQRSVALVGARKGTESGRAIARSLAAGLVARGCTVVSGLAVGIDAAAHRGALTALGGKTAAVLGSGFGHLYPEQNRGLAKAILSVGGLLMSEYPPGMTPRPYQFPERNRLISGVSEVTVLVEASVKSGFLITA
jgi:DNA processing protein